MNFKQAPSPVAVDEYAVDNLARSLQQLEQRSIDKMNSAHAWTMQDYAAVVDNHTLAVKAVRTAERAVWKALDTLNQMI